MKKVLFTFTAAALLAAPASAQQFPPPERQAQQKKTAQYWQVSYGYPQNAYTYNVSLEAQDLDAVEAKIMKLAEAAGIQSNYGQQYMYNKSATNRMFNFNTTTEKAEAFCQKVMTLAKLKQYSTYNTLNENTYNETKKKADSVNAELEGNKKLFEKLPIASVIMNDLAARYKGYLAAYETNKEKAVVTISLAVKPQPQPAD